MSDDDTNLPVAYYEARAALSRCVHLAEAKSWSDRMVALAAFARQAQDRELEVEASELRVRSERVLGTLLLQHAQTVGWRRGGSHYKTRHDEQGRFPKAGKLEAVEGAPPTLRDLGISHVLSDRAQKLAAVPEGEFEHGIEELRRSVMAGGSISARMIKRLAVGQGVTPQPKPKPAPASPPPPPPPEPQLPPATVTEISRAIKMLAAMDVEPDEFLASMTWRNRAQIVKARDWLIELLTAFDHQPFAE